MYDDSSAPGRDPEIDWTDEAVRLCSALIRFDTRIGSGDERAAAEHIAAYLGEIGLTPTIVEAEARRSNVVVTIPGRDDTLDALLIHMHLDVVPAEPADWSVHPLSGEVADGQVWGRGAVDMKDMAASVLAALAHLKATGRRPRRRVVAAFVADEENAGVLGAQWLVHEHAAFFDGVRTAIGEGGGWSSWMTPERRLYPLHTAEKGWAAIDVTAHGTAGHASRIDDGNPIRVLGDALGRLTADRFPIHLTDGMASLLRVVCEMNGTMLDEQRPEHALDLLGHDAAALAAGLRNTAHPTMVAGGYQSNVIPAHAHAELDARYLPGHWPDLITELTATLGPAVSFAVRQRTEPVTARNTMPFRELWKAATRAIRTYDETAATAPFVASFGTDATHFQSLGISCLGFMPLRLPRGFDFWSLFHGVDERVPVESLRFSARVLERLLLEY